VLFNFDDKLKFVGRQVNLQSEIFELANLSHLLEYRDMHTTFLICSLLACSITATSTSLATRTIDIQAVHYLRNDKLMKHAGQPQQDATQFSAVVSKTEAVFSLPLQSRSRWSWNRPETADNKQEYRMDVTIKNEDNVYTFGFYLWKRRGASAGSGSLNDLISKGQKSLFERTEQRLMTIVRDADVKVKAKGDLVVISLHDSKDLKRLFSSKPTEAIFKIKYPGEQEIQQTIPIVYQ
jgi:hypothetical protein